MIADLETWDPAAASCTVADPRANRSMMRLRTGCGESREGAIELSVVRLRASIHHLVYDSAPTRKEPAMTDSPDPMSLPQGDLGLLDPDVAERLLASTELARLAYVATDGTPRVVPMLFHWNGTEIVVSTFGARRSRRCGSART